jgi:hypothetical protein
MCSGTGIAAPPLTPEFVRCQSIRHRPPATGPPEKPLEGRSPRMGDRERPPSLAEYTWQNVSSSGLSWSLNLRKPI